jgi:hypothetical protein
VDGSTHPHCLRPSQKGVEYVGTIFGRALAGWSPLPAPSCAFVVGTPVACTGTFVFSLFWECSYYKPIAHLKSQAHSWILESLDPKDKQSPLVLIERAAVGNPGQRRLQGTKPLCPDSPLGPGWHQHLPHPSDGSEASQGSSRLKQKKADMGWE